MKRFGKAYRAKKELLEKDIYALDDAVDTALKTAPAKFDETVEIHMVLGVDVKKAEQMIRSTVALPEGTGKTVRVVAFVPDNKVQEAKDAGAVEAGSQDLIEKVQGGFLDFDIAVATPDMMKELGKIARVLGPKGLMPNPKTGTVTEDISKTVAELQGGKIEYRVDKTGVLHNGIGKVSFGTDRIRKNLDTYIQAVHNSKPAGFKGTFIKNVFLTTTMGPSIQVDTKTLGV